METRTPEMQKKGMTMGKAILKLSMYVNSGMLTVNVLKARHIFSRYTHNAQPYVQVCLSPDPSAGTNCYTAVSQGAPHPTFNEKFSFDVIHYSETLPGDGRRRVHISVWNSSGSPGSTAEFLGSMSFGLQHLLNKTKETSGWYYLLREDVGRRKHLPALMRSDVYQECGTISEETPLMPRKQNIEVTDVIVHRDFNADTLQKPFDSVDLQHSIDKIRPQILIHNSKQVRFDCGVSGSNVEKTMGGHYPASNNPYIQQYRREISALTTRTPQHNVNACSVLTGNSSLLLSSVTRQFNNDFALNPINSDSEYPASRPQHRNQCRRSSSFNDAVISPNTHNSITNRKLFQETSFNTRDSSERPHEERITNNLNKEQNSNIWVDCRQKNSLIETEHDSGICDSLSPSPKSEALTCCSCCRNSNRKYVDLVDTSINSDEAALDRYHSINNNEPTHDGYNSRYTQYSPDQRKTNNIAANMENCYNYNTEMCSDNRDHVTNKCNHSNYSHGNCSHSNCSYGNSGHGNCSHGNCDGLNVEDINCVHDQTSPLMGERPCCDSDTTRHTLAHNTQSHQRVHDEHSNNVPPPHHTHYNTSQQLCDRVVDAKKHRPFYPRHGRHFEDSILENGLSEFSTMNCVDHRDAWRDNRYDTWRPHGKHKANKRYTNQLQSDNRDHKASIHTKVYFL